MIRSPPWRPIARTYYDVVGNTFEKEGIETSADAVAELAVAIDDVVKKRKILNWQRKLDVQKQIEKGVGDEVFRFKEEHGVEIDFEAIDRILDTCIEVARRLES